MLKGGGGTTSFEVVLTQVLEVLAIGMGGGGRKRFHPLKGGGRKTFYPVLRGGEGSQKVSDPHFVDPPIPIFNDQSVSTDPLLDSSVVIYVSPLRRDNSVPWGLWF